MASFDWKEEYSVGIDLIDRQHQKVIELLNELLDSFRDGREDLIIRDVLSELKDFAESHFQMEARLFSKYRYDNADEHNREHAEFLAELASLAQSSASGNRDVPFATFVFLRNWFRDHEVKVDHAYAVFFASRGIETTLEDME